MTRPSAKGLKEVLVKTTASVAFYTGALRPLRFLSERYRLERKRVFGLSLPWLAKRRTRFVQVLTHHRVNDEHDVFLPATPTEVFAKRVAYLAAHYTICDANDLKRVLEQDDVPERAVMITFDDGYRDVFLNAYPILKEHGVPAIVFLPAAHIGTDRVLWHDQVAHAFRETQRTALAALEDDGTTYALESPDERAAAFRATVGYLRTLDAEARSRCIDQLHDELDVPRQLDEPGLMMTWDEVRAMQAGGIAFGSHTVNHPILSKLSPSDASREIATSKGLIEAELGVPVRVLAYPNGTRADFSEANKQAARDAGYDCALTTIFGVNKPGHDLFELRRGGPWEEHLPSFALKLCWYRLCS